MVSNDNSELELTRELVDWVNREFHCFITRIEQCGQGAIYLQIFDKIFPGIVDMSKVNWHSLQERDMEENFKLLQEALNNSVCPRILQTRSLLKRKKQEHIELLSWFKNIYTKYAQKDKLSDYDPISIRTLGIGPLPTWARPLNKWNHPTIRSEETIPTYSQINSENHLLSNYKGSPSCLVRDSLQDEDSELIPNTKLERKSNSPTSYENKRLLSELSSHEKEKFFQSK